jgi:hypothetical protein
MERIKMMSVVDVKQERMTDLRKRPPGALNGKLESGAENSQGYILRVSPCLTIITGSSTIFASP